MMYPVEDPTNLIVNYIPTPITDTQLRQLFEQYGELESARVIVDRQTSHPKGYGFVKFKEERCARMAIEKMNGFEILNKRLKVTPARGPQSMQINKMTAQMEQQIQQGGANMQPPPPQYATQQEPAQRPATYVLLDNNGMPVHAFPPGYTPGIGSMHPQTAGGQSPSMIPVQAGAPQLGMVAPSDPQQPGQQPLLQPPPMMQPPQQPGQQQLPKFLPFAPQEARPTATAAPVFTASQDPMFSDSFNLQITQSQGGVASLTASQGGTAPLVPPQGTVANLTASQGAASRT